MSDDAFMQVVSGCTEASQGLDLSDDGWRPPAGTYTVSIDPMVKGTKEGKGAWARLNFTIVSEGEFQGRSFAEFCWFPIGGMQNGRVGGGLRTVAKLATLLAGHEIKDPALSIQTIEQAVGELIEIERFDVKAKDDPNKVYKNLRFLNTVASS